MKVLKGNFAPVSSAYSRELRQLIERMLTLNPTSRPSIATILEKGFVKQRVAKYIFDCWKEFESDPGTDLDESKMNVLKEQGMKLGIFNSVLTNIDSYLAQQGQNTEQAEFYKYFYRKKKEREELSDFIENLERERGKILDIINTVSGQRTLGRFRPTSGEKSITPESRSKSKNKRLRPISNKPQKKEKRVNLTRQRICLKRP